MTTAVLLLAAATLMYCAKDIYDLAPFPCSVDGRCPGSFACIPDAGCTNPRLDAPCGGEQVNQCYAVDRGACLFHVCATTCAQYTACPDGRICVTDGNTPGSVSACAPDCSQGQPCPVGTRCLPTADGTHHACLGPTADADGGVTAILDMARFGGPGSFDMAMLPPPTEVAASALGGLSSDGTTVIWAAGSNSSSGPSLIMRRGPDDSAPAQVTMVDDVVVATTIYGGNIYFLSHDFNGARIKVVPLTGGTATPLVTNLPPLPFNQSGAGAQVYIQADASNLYWTTPSDSVTPSGTLSTAPLAGGAPTTLATALPVPSGLLLSGGATLYSTYGTSARNYADGALLQVGMDQPILSGTSIFGLQPGPSGSILVVKGGTILQLSKGGTSPVVVFAGDGTCSSTVPCPTALGSDGVSAYFAGAVEINSIFGRFAIYRGDGRPVCASATTTGSGPNFITVQLRIANGSLYWIAGGTVWTHVLPAP